MAAAQDTDTRKDTLAYMDSSNDRPRRVPEQVAFAAALAAVGGAEDERAVGEAAVAGEAVAVEAGVVAGVAAEAAVEERGFGVVEV